MGSRQGVDREREGGVRGRASICVVGYGGFNRRGKQKGRERESDRLGHVLIFIPSSCRYRTFSSLAGDHAERSPGT